jgi:hypothetical protein
MGLLFFFGAIYIPVVLLTIFGFYLMLSATGLRFDDVVKSIPAILAGGEKLFFYELFLFIAGVITVVKIDISGIEKKFILDALVIHLTNGCLLSGIITPTLFYIRNKIKKVS